MQIRQCEMCQNCKVKVNSNMSLNVSCRKGIHDVELVSRFDNRCKCNYYEPISYAEFYPLIFTKYTFE